MFSDPKFNACTRSLFHSPWSKRLITSSSMLSITTLQALLANTIGCILQTDDKSMEIKHRCSRTAWSYGSTILRCWNAGCSSCGRSLARPFSLQRVWAAKWTLMTIFAFCLCFLKSENPLWISSSKEKRVLMQVFHKSKVAKRKLWESGETCTTLEHGH